MQLGCLLKENKKINTRSLEDYYEELRIKNPGSTVILDVFEDPTTRFMVFRRFYGAFFFWMKEKVSSRL